MAKYMYDLIVIGGGSGGLVAARLGRAFGARTALIDKERLGGDCLHYGCVPSKSLIHVAKMVKTARETAEFGLVPPELTVDMGKVSERIAGVIKNVEEAEGVYTQGVDVKFGHATFRSPHELDLDGQILTSQAFIVATGSRPAVPRIEGLKEVGFLTNEQVFDLTKLPPSLIVIGGGPIGVELGQSFARLGSKVTLIQGPDRILPKEEPETSKLIAQLLIKEGLTIITGARAKKAYRHAEGKKVVEVTQGEETRIFEADEILLAMGRTPNCDELNLEAAGVEFDAKGIKVDEYLQTTAKNITAIGDVIGGYLFTHVAAYQAGVALQNSLLPIGKKKVDYRVLPWVTFCDPEASRVGMTEEEARTTYKKISVHRFAYGEVDRAQAEGETEGFIKLVLDEKGETIYGAHIVGAHSGELLAEIALAMQHNLGVSDILATIHAYPTFSTGIQTALFEAYLSGSKVEGYRKILKPILAVRG
jgi:pyruvate/2-oxoglutarate dehydrogenase complex dihydrolipoamide dehydrogenase (E3) component